jgi:hypothetical protein
MPIQGHYFGGEGVIKRPHPDIELRSKPSEQGVKLALKLCEMLDPHTLQVEPQVSLRDTSPHLNFRRIFINKAWSLADRRNLSKGSAAAARKLFVHFTPS